MKDERYEVTKQLANVLINGLIHSTRREGLEWEGGPREVVGHTGGFGMTAFYATRPHPSDAGARVRYHLRATGHDNPHELTVLEVRGDRSERLVYITGCFPDLWNAVAMTAFAWPSGEVGGMGLAMEALDSPRKE